MTWEVCSWAIENNKTSPAAKLRLKGQSKALISGFSAWRRGSAALSKHQNSQHYKECMNVRCTLTLLLPHEKRKKMSRKVAARKTVIINHN